MIPLTVRRAGCFEKSMFLATAAIGVIGTAVGILGSPVQISGSLGAVLGAAAAVYFAGTMVVPGVLGFWTVRHSQRLRTPAQIDTECRLESWMLAGMCVGWTGFTAAAVVAGFRAIAITILMGAICVACVWRMLEIRRDLRRLHAAIEAGPLPSDPPPIAEGP